jgi:hypothetical protein
MNDRRHPFFGTITPTADGSFVWQSTAGNTPLELHVDRVAEMTDASLDALARLYGQFPTLDGLAREAIKRDSFDPAGAAKMYVEFVHENLPDAGRDDVLGSLVAVRLWSLLEGDDNVWVAIDYSFAPNQMNQILSAQFDASACVVALAMES